MYYNDNINNNDFLSNNYRNNRRLYLMILTYISVFFVGALFISTLFICIYALITNQSINNLYTQNRELVESANLFVNGWTNFTTYLIGTIIIVMLGLNFLKNDLTKLNQDFFKYVILGIGLNLLAGFVSNIINQILKIQGETTNQEAINKLVQSPYLPLMVITTIVFAPFVEELIFRKVLCEVIEQKKYLPSWFIIILSGFLFASIHVIIPMISALIGGNGIWSALSEFLYIIPYLTMGIALSFVYYRSNKNIWVVITIHAINNLFALLIMLFYLLT